MSETQKDFEEIFEKLKTLSEKDKIQFIEELLFYFTLTVRGIWSDEKLSDLEKASAFKWLNELTHRIWNIRSNLKDGEDNQIISRLYENVKFYAEQSEVLRMHLGPTIFGAYSNFKIAEQ